MPTMNSGSAPPRATSETAFEPHLARDTRGEYRELGAAAGSISMGAVSVGGYWTHYGLGGWYIDAVTLDREPHGNRLFKERRCCFVAEKKWRRLNVTIASARPFTAVSRTMSSSEPVRSGRQRNANRTGSATAAGTPFYALKLIVGHHQSNRGTQARK